LGGDHIPSYNVAPGLCPWMLMLREGRLEFASMTWGYRTPSEAAHIAQSRPLPTEEFVWWKGDRAVNHADPNNNGEHLLTPITEPV